MEHEVSIENTTLKNERMADASGNPSEEHVFKKARYAWQIKGHTSTDNTINDEASCGRSDNFKPDTSNSFSNSEYKHIEDSNAQDSAVNGIQFPVMSNTNAGCVSEIGYDNDYVNSDSQKHSDMIEFIGNKRKVDLLNFKEESCRPKRLKNLENTNSRKDSDTRSANVHIQADRLVNMQAGVGNVPDLRQSMGSLLRNCQGFDIPSFIWLKQEMGCAIVDNVFNRTLEEMGLSPDPVVNLSATTRLTVENQSIESAIRNQGLRANNSVSDHDAILRNMEEMRRTATRADFEHTQSQLYRMLAGQSPSQTVNTDSVIDSDDDTEKNCAMHVEILDLKENDKEMSHKTRCGTSGDDNSKLSKTFVTSTSANEHNDHEESAEKFRDKNISHIKHQIEGNADKMMGPISGKNECTSMEEIENIQCKDVAEKGPDTVLDLAVSTAIMNQGLTFE